LIRKETLRLEQAPLPQGGGLLAQALRAMQQRDLCAAKLRFAKGQITRSGTPESAIQTPRIVAIQAQLIVCQAAAIV
jgi:hypothetical protein